MIAPYIFNILILICIYVILATSLNFALGYTGLLNLGHIAFFGIGAYASVLLVQAGIPYIIALPAAGVIAGFFGFLLILATRKIKGDYLALVTLGFSFVIHSVLLNWTSVTRGPLGIPGIPKPSILGFTISSGFIYFIFALIIAFITWFILNKIVNSPFGRLMQATRDDELGLRVLGKNTSMIKTKVLIISAFFAGIAGSLFAHHITFIDPASFSLQEIILVLTIVIVGGLASLRGSIFATIIILVIPEILRFLSLPGTIVGPARNMIYAVILVAILLWRPRGLFGRVDLN
ncbi:branched-chain amino acid ABC transporter permease [Candidatus Woesearchaeota archaeon]|nr:branched-chain amino acid ABC transporter permease [Candidatus Woesearchaeota archaeon]